MPASTVPRLQFAGRSAAMLLCAGSHACGLKPETASAEKAKSEAPAKAADAATAKGKEALDAGVEAVAYGSALLVMELRAADAQFARKRPWTTGALEIGEIRVRETDVEILRVCLRTAPGRPSAHGLLRYVARF